MSIYILATISFLLLYILSHKLFLALFQFVYLLTESKKISMHLLALLFLPGTFVHEFSHLLIATLLHVSTGKLTLRPEFEPSGGIRAGSLQLAKSDPFRGTLIGLAPVIVGLTILGILGYLMRFAGLPLSSNNHIFLVAFCLLLFEIGNTMFTSKSDLRDAVIVGCFLLGLGLLLYGLEIKISFVLPSTFIEQFQGITESISISLIGAATLDIILLIIITVCTAALRHLRNYI